MATAENARGHYAAFIAAAAKKSGCHRFQISRGGRRYKRILNADTVAPAPQGVGKFSRRASRGWPAGRRDGDGESRADVVVRERGKETDSRAADITPH